MYEEWIEQHQDRADEIVIDKRSGMVVSAVYYNPVAMNTSERLDFFTNAARLDLGRDNEDDQ